MGLVWGVTGGWISPSHALGNPVTVFHVQIIFSSTEGSQSQGKNEEDPVDHMGVSRHVVSKEMIQATFALREECSVLKGKAISSSPQYHTCQHGLEILVSLRQPIFSSIFTTVETI